MIPQKLVLKNFLSHPHTVVNFDGLHTACICGANGAGKSSLLEGITWVLWGKSRVDGEDDLIYVGANEVQVDFIFLNRGACYRVIRTRSRGSASTVELQILSEGKFRSLTERGLRATQQMIVQHLKMDYETFIHSAYLRQGQADAFMLKRPPERKQVLAEILQLSQYDRLSEKAKDIARMCKGELSILSAQMQRLRAQLQETDQIEASLSRMRATEASLQEQLQQQESQQQQWEKEQQLRNELQQKLLWQKSQLQQLEVDRHRSEQQQASQYQQCQNLQKILEQRASIEERYTQYQQISHQEADLAQRCQHYQYYVQQRQEILQQLSLKKSDLQVEIRHFQTQWDTLQAQQKELAHILDRQEEIGAAQQKCQQAREQLIHYDRLQSQAAPLQQRVQQLQRTIEQEKARLLAQQQTLQQNYEQLQRQMQQEQPLQQALLEIDRQIVLLQKKQVYQQRVHEKGLERRDFLERLKVRLQDCEERWQQTQNNLQQLGNANAPCPLCDQPLEGKYWEHVQQKHHASLEELQAEIWLIKEQQSTSEVEIQVLREEYARLRQELQPYSQYLEQKGKLQSQLQATQEMFDRAMEVQAELTRVATKIERQEFCIEVFQELEILGTSLKRLAYDERDHALTRNEVERWRWAELKAAELKQARQNYDSIAQKLPEIQQQMQRLTNRLQKQEIDFALQEKLRETDRQLTVIGYDPIGHQKVREHKEKMTTALLQHQELLLAQQQYPLLQQQYQQTRQSLEAQLQTQTTLQQAIQNTELQCSQIPDRQQDIAQLKEQAQQNRIQRENCLSEIGKLLQVQQQRSADQQQIAEIITQQKQTEYRQRLHQELAQSFGKNGIQTLMIETIIPQIEAEANQILGQLSNYQFNVRFITQKSGKKADKFIDTLEIEIADSKGTRPYETYSGGEAFRINFAVRLALSRILAQRTGGTLQTLIIDEGFGSQDREGCERLVSAIEAIANDFACILVITHIPQLKEAFTNVIEVTKTTSGSKVNLVL